jgi:hypothetical protein
MNTITRNRKELIWIALNTAAAIANLWFASWPGNIGWLHLLFWVAHAIIVGVYVTQIFENRRLDAIYTEIEDQIADIEAVDDPYLAGEIRRVLNDEVSQ